MELNFPMQPERPRRVIVVSDTLPVAIVPRDNDASRGSWSDCERSRRRRRDSLAFQMDMPELQPTTEEHSPVGNLERFELVERQNHAAHWVGSYLKCEVIRVGKPFGLDPLDWQDNFALQAEIKDRLWNEKGCIPVLLNEKVHRGHWDGYCRSSLWSLFHYTLWESNKEAGQSTDWENYVKANEAFCDVILSILEPNDIIWILDYQLMVLPVMLKKREEGLTVALFLRSPFPSSEFIRCLPQAKELLSGALGADVIGFQTFGYARHFISSCTRILGCETTPNSVDNGGIPVRVVVQPVGIDPIRIKRLRSLESVKDRIRSIKDSFGGKKIILGLESTDQSRGIIHKLKSIEKLFTIYPEMVGTVVLIQAIYMIGDPKSRLDARVSQLVSKINGSFGSFEYNPINVFHQLVEKGEYLALLSVADILLITSERDSVNTLVLDYIACQEETQGIPIISEFIGLAGVLPTKFQVNPWDHLGTAKVIREVLHLSVSERHKYCEKISRFVKSNTTENWVDSFLSSVMTAASRLDAYHSTPLLRMEKVLECYTSAERRLILLDYDGTLTPIRKTPSAATPSQEVIRSLRSLTSDPTNLVYIISGRDQNILEEWLGSIPRLGMSAEHGCFLRPVMEAGELSSWISIVSLDELGWKDDVTKIMEYYTERTPGSIIESKAASLTWHYRLADPDFGSWQAKEMLTHLDQAIASKYSVEIVSGKKNLEVRPKTSNKGEIIRMLIERHGMPQFILCAGDDRTDEDMFRALDDIVGTSSPVGNWCFTCSIGTPSKKTLARYHVNNPEQIVSLLMRLGSMMTERLSGLTL